MMCCVQAGIPVTQKCSGAPVARTCKAGASGTGGQRSVLTLISLWPARTVLGWICGSSELSVG